MNRFPVVPAARYEYYRPGFRADVIEALDDSDYFEVVTPVGTFRLSKLEFYRDFPNVTRSRSYREAGIYHYPTVPGKAERYRVG